MKKYSSPYTANKEHAKYNFEQIENHMIIELLSIIITKISYSSSVSRN